jgi:methyl-accepting chemotaxis protein
MGAKRGLTIARRLYLLLGSMLAGLVLLGGYAAIELRSSIMEEKRLMLKAIVDVSVGIVEQQYELARAGRISEADAQRQARDDLRKVRYNEGADYLFIYDMNGINIMHGAKPDREGKPFIDSKDPNGKPYIRDWIDLLKRDGKAYIEYQFPKPGSTVAVPKVSYARTFAPWGWWIGTGVYIDDVESDFHRSVIGNLIFLVAILAVLAGLGFTIQRGVRAQIGGEPASAAAQVEDFAAGDLSRPIRSESSAPGNLLSSLGAMQAKLADIVREIRGSSETLARQSSDLSVSAKEISQAAGKQAESSAATAAAIEELTVSISEVSEIATATEANSNSTAELAGQGGVVVRQSAEGMQGIADAVEQSAARIQTLVGRSQEIGSITQVIKEIADQTNLLALNAAIEAARAGETGRGFAVVADEVRKLAERTGTATAEISQMVMAIQDDTQRAVEAMASATPRVAEGRELAGRATALLEDIQRQANDSLAKARDVANATKAQAQTANEIARHVETIASMTEQTNAATSSNAEAADQLQALARRLQQDLAYFKT